MTDEQEDKPKTAYDYPQIYKRIGMELGHFGAVMLDVDPVDVSGILGDSEDWYYSSSNPKLRYVKGPVGEVQAHVTLLYGLTPDDNAAQNQKESIKELLDGLDLSSVTIEEVDSFPPQYGEPYQCVVGKLQTDTDLGEANRRLRFLPHIDTFLDFKAHVTLAYVKEDLAGEAISKLAGQLEGVKLNAVGLNFGGELK
jgi:2'-5' RNA ligase